jgi:GAF domain-containing protein
MTDRSLRRAAWLLAAISVAGAVSQVGLLLAARVPLLSAEAVDRAFPIITTAVVIGALVGAVIVGRLPRHRIGWLFCLGQAGAAVGLVVQTYSQAVLKHGFGASLQLGQLAGQIGHLLGSTYGLALLGLLLLLVPDGHLPSRRWWPVAVLLAGGYLLGVAGVLLTSPRAFSADGTSDAGLLADLLQTAGGLAITLGLVGGAVSLVVRLRRARGDERQQLRWIGAAAGLLAVMTVLLLTNNVAHGGQPPGDWFVSVLFYLGYLSVPVATGIAVLRYRLYDIDLIIGRAVRLAVLGVFVTAGYVACVVGIGAVVGGSAAVWPSLLAYVLVALAFQPMRRRVDRFADRVVYGDRAAPYDSLAELSRQLGAGGLSQAQLLGQVARCSALATGAVAARATVAVPDGPDVTETWPPGSVPPAQVTIPVGHESRQLGRIELALPPGGALDRTRRRLLTELAAQADLAFRNIRLTAALRARAGTLARQHRQLTASRRRLLDAADAERRRIATAIRSDVAAHLEPLPSALAELAERMPADPEGARHSLEGMRQSITLAIDAMRAMTAGLLPPLLARRGLVAALESHAARSASRPRLAIGADLAQARFGTSVEAAAYACCVTALSAMQVGATVCLEATADTDGEHLLVAVAGRRAGRPPDLQLVVDRIEAIGGRLELDGQIELYEACGSAVPDAGLVVRASIPLAPSAQAAASRSGPNADLAT